MDLNSFLTSLGTSFAIFLVLVLLYSWLSRVPVNAVVYYPNRMKKGSDHYPNKDYGSTNCCTWNPFGWIRQALHSTEQDIISMSGVDTAVYFLFLTTILKVLFLSGLVLLPVLLPVAETDDRLERIKDEIKDDLPLDLQKLSMGNVDEKSARLWAFLIGVYCVSFVSYYLLWKAYKHVSGLRSKALMSSEVKPEQYAVLVRDIPPPQVKGKSRKQQVDDYFKAIYPHTFYKSMVATDNRAVNVLWKKLEKHRKNLAQAEAIYEESKRKGIKSSSPEEGAKPTHKIGFLGLCGRKVDSIEYYTQKINNLEPKLEEERKKTLRDKQLNAALVFFTSRVAAASAAQTLHSQLVDQWTVTEAPQPCQLLWPNLRMKFFERHLRKYVVYFIVALTIFFYMIPITFISAFTTLTNLKKFLIFLNPLLKLSIVRTVLEAYLPQIVLITFLSVLPMLLLFLSKAEGISSLSHAQRAAAGKFFYFTVLNVFLGVTLGGTLFSTFKEIQKNPNSIVELLASSIPQNAAFFISYVALKFFVGYGVELSRIVALTAFHIKRKLIFKTEAEEKEAWPTGDLGYHTKVPEDMLVVTIVLCYSVISPIIIAFGVAHVGIGWLVVRNQALNVYVTQYESYGQLWPHMVFRILAAMILYQVTMFGYFGVKEFYYTPLLLPLPILTFLFGFICQKRFHRSFHHIALEITASEQVADLEQVYKSFIPPTLNSDKINNNPDHMSV
ncbi:CSC1-like protein ERD4 [Humulus lupulus]|uniref:CSC1-like protein ERD4 n=1 Tax=Humulus lupulus TaxID=3486 RepID=UPI002B40AB77|nr:CSC1-like protein ERD4 [Humulus lupulus]